MRIPKVKSKDLISVTDFNREEVLSIFKFARKLKGETKKGKMRSFLSHRSLAMIFEKSSTRTRVSFETGITQLGGHALFLNPEDIQLKRGETISDTARVLSRYVDAIMIRSFSHEKVAELAQVATVPVINGLTDRYHPCQALTDLFTVYEIEPRLDQVKIAYVGDGNNVAKSLMLCAALLGTNISLACPDVYSPDNGTLEKARRIAEQSGSELSVTSDVDSAVEGAQYIYTDVWVSMGEEAEAERKKAELSPYRITMELIRKCAPGCRIMHCLPAHRDEEIESEVLDSENSIIFEQAENRLHVQKAIMCALILG